MSQGAFAAKKVRKNMENRYYDSRDLKQDASNYNSKYMNSIWGMYNRFSVHNLKKIMDDNTCQSEQWVECWLNIFDILVPWLVFRASVGQAVKGLAAYSGLSVSMERLSYLPQWFIVLTVI